MITFFSILAYGAICLLVYIYFGYPFFLFILSKCTRNTKITKAKIRPSVSLIISCFNEEKVIRDKLENSLSLHYPKEKLQIVVVSDASSDRTENIVREYASQGIKLIRQKERLGKTAGLNLAVSQTTSEIIVFSDANAIYDRNAVIKLVENFADEDVGYVVGHAKYLKQNNSAARSENTYWRYETFIKNMESKLHSIVGGDGAIYAIRRQLYEPLQHTDINDFVNPLQIILKGYRGVFEPEAICWEETSGSFRKEFSRKARIVNRSFSGFLRVKSVLNPIKTGFFSLQILSHKLLRWFSPIFVLLLGVSCLILSSYNLRIFLYLIMLTILFLWFAYIGHVLSEKSEVSCLFYYPYYYISSNIATLLGLFRSLRGRVETTWNPARIETEATRNGKSCLNWVMNTLLGLSIWVFLMHLGMVANISLLTEKTIFLICVVVILYVYLGYPVIIYGLSKLCLRRGQQKDRVPYVTLLICAYNEEDIIEEKIINSLNLDYPEGRLKIVIASDGSSDKTNHIVSKYVNERLSLIAHPVRRGKIGVINAIVPELECDIVVFSDANTMYAPDAIRKLVRNFADRSVGCVSGNVMIKNNKSSLAQAEGVYWRYERWLQEKESDFGSVIGADGAMYAIRRELFTAPSANIIVDDFVISMNVALRGYRVVYAKEAIGFEDNGISLRNEFLRQSRVIAGAVQALKQKEGVPLMRQRKLFFCFLSHKVLRWMMPVYHIMLLLANIRLFLTYGTGIYAISLIAQAGFYVLALFGFLFKDRCKSPVFSLPCYYCLENGAALYGIYKGLFNKQSVKWQKFRRKYDVAVNQM